MSDAGNKVCNRYGKTYPARRIKPEPMFTQCEDQYSCSIIKVEKDSEDDGYDYILELEPCDIKEEEHQTVHNAIQIVDETVSCTVKDEIEIGPTVIQPQYIGSSLHTTDASKAELIQCGGADVALDTTTSGTASHRTQGSRSVVLAGTTDQTKDKGILEGNNLSTLDDKKPFACNICEYKCSVKSNLKKHMRVHTGEKPFSCNICEYKCKFPSRLVPHMCVHTGEKPFSCNICEYKCVFESSLVRHFRKHTGEKPYFCTICRYKSVDRSSLVRHMRTHT